MADIKNDKSLVEEFALNIKREASGFQLKMISGTSCKNVDTDRVFDQTYNDGKNYAENLQVHVEKAQGYIEQISTTLIEADRISAFGITGGKTVKFIN